MRVLNVRAKRAAICESAENLLASVLNVRAKRAAMCASADKAPAGMLNVRTKRARATDQHAALGSRTHGACVENVIS